MGWALAKRVQRRAHTWYYPGRPSLVTTHSGPLQGPTGPASLSLTSPRAKQASGVHIPQPSINQSNVHESDICP